MTTTPRRFVDIHLLQTVPYANLNRDDLGSPKNLVYGGATRTRVSSQCWKRATRLAIQAELGDPAVRTRRVAQQVATRLHDDGWPDDLAAFAGRQVLECAGAGLKAEKDGMTSSVLLYLPRAAIDGLADLARTNRDALERARRTEDKQKGKDEPKGRDKPKALPASEVAGLLAASNGSIALFGRMLAELPGAQVDGAVQVAHAFTTHATEPELDFFTAVDDLNPAEEHGSGHMNTAEFSAGVFYRYASVDTTELTCNLDGDTAAARTLTAAFLRAFIGAVPGGKRTATAPNTVPDLAYAVVRADRPLSLASAFEAPVRAGYDNGWAEPSRRVMAEYADTLHRLWGTAGLILHAHAGVDPKSPSGLGDQLPSYAALVEAITTSAFADTLKEQR